MMQQAQNVQGLIRLERQIELLKKWQIEDDDDDNADDDDDNNNDEINELEGEW